MIQRKQSVYLLLGAAAISAVFFFDWIYDSRAAASLAWFVPSVIASGAVTCISAVVALFLYENRQVQQRIVVAVQVLDLIFIVLLVGGMFLTGTLQFPGSGPNAVARTLTLVLPLLAYLFFYLARRGIQADIELIKSMDRLR